MSQRFSVLIVGAGRVGATFDTPGDSSVLTHAHAFSKHPGFHLVGFLDTDENAAATAARLWGGSGFTSLEDAPPVDVVCLATPDPTHAEYLKKLATKSVKFVFCEKPLALTLTDAVELVHSFRSKRIGLGVNYTRPFVPEIQRLRDRIRSGEFGRLIGAQGIYGKGILHNGTHVINLLQFLLGRIGGSITIRKNFDYTPEDPTCSAILRLDSGEEVFLRSIDHTAYALIEADILFEKKRLRIVDSGCRIEESNQTPSPHFKGFTTLLPSYSYETGFSRHLEHSARALYATMSRNTEFPCTGEDALDALRVALAVRDGAPGEFCTIPRPATET